MFQKLEAVENRYEELNKKLQTQKLLQIQANGQSS